MHFPKYDYDDMIEAQHRMLTEGLGITHLRLIMGTSMGCMHSFVWGETYPDFASALMPLACEPIEIAGLNRMWRQLAINGVEADPAWQGGNYTSEPMTGLRAAENLLFVAGSAPLLYQTQYPTRITAGAYAEQRVASAIKTLDANDLIYQLDSSRNYNPWPGLDRIRVPLIWINSADDFINPRNLPVSAEALKRMPTARFRLIPETAETHGHGTHTWAKFWKQDLSELLARSR
jgi:homoserine O-acetyltransferase